MTTADTLRTVEIERRSRDHYVATNVRGGTLDLGTGDDDHFTPVELLLVAIGACSGIDVDYIAGKRADAEQFRVSVRGDKIRDDDGNRMTNLAVDFQIVYPAGDDGDRAREVLPRAIAQSHDRLCSVSRTVELGTPVAIRLVP